MTVREYFEQLATEHTMVRHRPEEEPHFACSMDDAATQMARRLHYPAVFLDEGDMVVAGTAGGELLQRQYGLAFATHVQDSGNEAEKETAFRDTETVMCDFLARMTRDKGKGLAPVRRFSPFGAEAHRVELADAGLYGWLLLFTLDTNLSTLNCNEHFRT